MILVSLPVYFKDISEMRDVEYHIGIYPHVSPVFLTVAPNSTFLGGKSCSILDEVFEVEEIDDDDEPRIATENYASLLAVVGQAPVAVATYSSLSAQRVFTMLESKKRERGFTVSSSGSKEGRADAPHPTRSPSASYHGYPHIF